MLLWHKPKYNAQVTADGTVSQINLPLKANYPDFWPQDLSPSLFSKHPLCG